MKVEDDGSDNEQDETISALVLNKAEKSETWLARWFSHSNIADIGTWIMERAEIRFSLSIPDVSIIFTLYVVFALDIMMLTSSLDQSSSVKTILQTIMTIAFFFFIIEFLMTIWVKSDIIFRPFSFKGYIFSFYFWLDLVIILSILPDIEWLADRPYYGHEIYSRTGKFIRIIRCLRLVKYFKV